jgi:hypothetical protein
MSEIKQVWAINFPDLEPLPALLVTERVDVESRLLLYNRRDKCFPPYPDESFPADLFPFFDTFDECRIEMIARRMEALHEKREKARQLVLAIEHIKSLPIATFPDAPQIQEQQQLEGQLRKAVAEGAGFVVGKDVKVTIEEVKPAAPAPQQIKRPSRKN